jgi:hypothetical protein
MLLLPDGTTCTVMVKPFSRSPTPGILDADAHSQPLARALYIVPVASASLRKRAAENKVDLIEMKPATVTMAGQVWPASLTPTAVTQLPHLATTSPASRPPWGRWATMRALLLAGHPLTQHDLAAAAAISQPAVSQSLKQLGALVTRAPGGWVTTDRDALLHLWLSEYVGPGGASTYWFSLDPPVRQAQAATALALRNGSEALLTGDAAADIYAPTRLPRTGQLCVSQIIDFTQAGLTPATPAEATFIATIPADATLWPMARAFGPQTPPPPSGSTNVPLADPLIIYWDVLHASGADADQAAAAVLRKLSEAWNA